VAPATIELSSAELELANTIGRDGALAAALDPAVRAGYDYVLIDTPPTLGLLTINGLVAADSVLIPVQAHFYAVKGMAHLLRLIRQVRLRLNERLRVLGILPTFYDARTNLARQVVESLRDTYPGEVFDTMVRTAVRVAEAPIAGRSVLAYAPASEAAVAYRELAQEVMRRAERPAALAA
jgi:chromosome partitioning protein